MTDPRVASLAALLQQGWKESGYQPNYSYIDLRTLADWLLARGVQYAAPCECPSDHVGNQWHTPACQKQGAR